uniref:Uncharacterized protein n=1 Tax=Arundo donax TaxID=35708 RepID=A0A0A9GRM7_ARUDO
MRLLTRHKAFVCIIRIAYCSCFPYHYRLFFLPFNSCSCSVPLLPLL